MIIGTSVTPPGLSPFYRVERGGGLVRISRDGTRLDGCRQSVGMKQKGGGGGGNEHATSTYLLLSDSIILSD